MDQLIKLFVALLDNPATPRPYRDLERAYRSQGLEAEAAGFEAVLRDEFGERGDES